MNSNAEKWVAALESGQYEQGIGSLHSTVDGQDLYCCLGVACEVARENGIDLNVQERHSIVLYDEQGEFLPDKVKEWLGLRSDAGATAIFQEYEEFFVGETLYVSLATANDAGVSFKEIAQAIRDNESILFEMEAD